jgi:hypothetical protein
MPNAPKLNNAWWRWFGSGPRNPPVIIRLHGSAKVHRLGTIAGQRSRESALGDGAMAVIGPPSSEPANQTYQPCVQPAERRNMNGPVVKLSNAKD